MTSPLDSQSWYRVSDLKPRLRHHIRVHRHRYRGARWYVLENPSTGRIHRLDEYAYQMVAFMDGQRSLNQVWLMISEKFGDLAPTQDQSIQLLGQLHSADVLHCDVSPDTRELFSRYEEHTRSRLMQMFRSPFFVRIPLIDPERWLNKWASLPKFLFSRWTGLAVFLIISVAAIAAAMHWEPLLSDARNSLLSPINLLLLWLVYPLVKALHELGHALAVKHWGGEVHDTGVMLLVFMPIPYVDASAANAFDNKWARMVVAGAGIAVELLLAAVAMGIWLAVEPGLVRMIALDVMIIGGISTLLFNGNPLLKFDGYYVLSDLVEIPNLSSRSNQYYGYLVRRYLLGIHGARSPAHGAGERNWFIFYGFAAFAYRTFILIAILLFVAGFSLTAAVVLGTWAIVGQIVVPFSQKIKSMMRDPLVRERRLRGIAVSLVSVVAITAVLLIPMPHRSTAQGVVWMGEDAHVRTGTDCVVERLLVEPDTQVRAGDALVECSDPLLQSQLAVIEAQFRELKARLTLERTRDISQAEIVTDELTVIEDRLTDARQRVADLVVRSPSDGVFVMPAANNLPQRFIEQGELIGYVLDTSQLSVRVAIGQPDIGLIRTDVQAVAARLSDDPATVHPARVRRLLPGATKALPSAALGSSGGGSFVADPGDETGRTSMEPVFLVDLEFDDIPMQSSGGRVFVRFEHSPAPLGLQWYRDIRQLLLRRLAV